MIAVLTNEQDFDYDIYSLVKAFYPCEDVKVFRIDETVEECKVRFLLTKENDTYVFLKDNVCLSTESFEENSDRVLRKNAVKRVVYKGLSSFLGKELPWGDLTGIRPTKISRKMFDEGKSDEEVYRYLKDTYLVSDEKALLSMDISKREREILRPLRHKGYSLYIGIPFCPTTCLYCSFTSLPISMWKKSVMDYLKALEKEIAYVAKLGKDKIIDTIYIGGGTPTSLDASELEELLSFIEEHFDVLNLLEFTVEAGRPDSITKEKLQVLLKHHVTRISVNPQTMNQETLDFIGRRHTVSDVKNAFYLARETGFNNINMDIILGLPGEGAKEVSHTVDEIVRLSPDSFTVHSLAVKRGSRLYEAIRQKGYPEMINTDETMKIAAEGASLLGMKPYYLYRQKNMAGNLENTGFAKEGCYGIYNILIMEEVQSILACGAGTVTKRVYEDGSNARCDTVKDIKMYIENIDEMIERKRTLFEVFS